MKIDENRIELIAKDLSLQAGITVEQANKILRILKIDDLVKNFHSLKRLYGDADLARSLGYYPEDAKKIYDNLNEELFELKNMGLMIKNRNLADISPPV